MYYHLDVRWRCITFEVFPACRLQPFLETHATPLQTFAPLPIQVLGNLLPERRLATATCVEPCTLLRVDGTTFRRALEDPEAQRTVQKKVSRWFRAWRRAEVLPTASIGYYRDGF